jgi:hypothetical protein
MLVLNQLDWNNSIIIVQKFEIMMIITLLMELPSLFNGG